MRCLAGLVIGPTEYISLDLLFLYRNVPYNGGTFQGWIKSHSQRDVSTPSGEREGYQRGEGCQSPSYRYLISVLGIQWREKKKRKRKRYD